MAVLLVLGSMLPVHAQEAEPATAALEADRLQAEADEAERHRAAASRQVEQAQVDLATARQRLLAAQAAERVARRNVAVADHRLREVETDIVPRIRDLIAAERDQVRLERRLSRLQAERRSLQRDIAVTRSLLEDRAVRAFKRGSIMAETALPLQLVREATSPGDLARGLKDLEVIAGATVNDLQRLLDALTRVEGAIIVARHELDDALARQQMARDRIEEAEQLAAGLRRTALDREGALVQALRRELAATQAVDRAQQALERAAAHPALLGDKEPDRLGPVDAHQAEDSGNGIADEEDDDFATRVARRERALKRQRSLPAPDRTTERDWHCPVDAGARFLNDWGFPRSGDRKHEGTDVFVPIGTPVLAVKDGVVTRANRVESGLGGITVSFEDGRDRYYNAHLRAIHPDIHEGVEVAAGQVIGWVGQTGNARGTPPHLHFGWYRDDVAVNPYTSLALACGS